MTLFTITLLATLPSIALTAPTIRGSVSSTLTKRGAEGAAYVTYSGDGANWPSTSSWISSFDDLFSANRAIIAGSCTQFSVANPSDAEISDIYDAINTVSSETGVDSRFILAVMLQESNGCVRAPTTNYGVRNPGLMQDHDGKGTCNDAGNIQNPCSASQITQMIRDGVAGTAAGAGLKQTYAQAPGTGAQKYYGAARIYNSGSIAIGGNLDAGIATHCYASDVANRLAGWTLQQKSCTFDGAPVPASTPSLVASSLAPALPPAQPAAPSVAPAAVPAPSVPHPALPAIATTSSKATAIKLVPGASMQCAEYYTIQAGDYCDTVAQRFGTSFATLRQLNTQLDASCSNLWKGYDYCVKSS